MTTMRQQYNECTKEDIAIEKKILWLFCCHKVNILWRGGVEILGFIKFINQPNHFEKTL